MCVICLIIKLRSTNHIKHAWGIYRISQLQSSALFSVNATTYKPNAAHEANAHRAMYSRRCAIKDKCNATTHKPKAAHEANAHRAMCTAKDVQLKTNAMQLHINPKQTHTERCTAEDVQLKTNAMQLHINPKQTHTERCIAEDVQLKTNAMPLHINTKQHMKQTHTERCVQPKMCN